MTLEDIAQQFTNDVYPSAEETITNNASVLYRRKKHFLSDLRRVFNALGYILIALLYLKDISMTRFIMRAFSQFSLSNPYPVPSPSVVLSDENKKAMSKFLLLGVFSANFICFATHFLFGAYKVAPQLAEDGQTARAGNWFYGGRNPDMQEGSTHGDLNLLYGGIVIQFIGERLPFSYLELLMYDVCIFGVQLVYHGLMCEVDDSKVLQSAPIPSLTQPSAFGSSDELELSVSDSMRDDGYNGNVDLVDINIVANVKKVMKYNYKLHMANLGMMDGGGDAATAAAATTATAPSGPITSGPGGLPIARPLQGSGQVLGSGLSFTFGGNAENRLGTQDNTERANFPGGFPS